MASLCQFWFCLICKNSSSLIASEVTLCLVTNITTFSFNNSLVNLLNDSSNLYYGFFNINSQRILKPRWIKNKYYNTKRYTHSSRRGHTIDKCHWLHDFPPNYKRRKFFGNTAIAIKKINESEAPTRFFVNTAIAIKKTNESEASKRVSAVF